MSGHRTALGIEIAEKQIRLVLLKKNAKGIDLLKTAECPVPEGAIKNGNIDNPVALVKAIKKLKLRNRISAHRIALSLPANPMLSQILDMPKETTGNVRQYINNEVKHYAILPINKTAMDFCKIKSSIGSGNKRALVVATDGQKISLFVNALYRKGINIDLIEPAWMAYARACYQKKVSKNPKNNLLFAMVNHGMLTLSLFKDQILDFVRTKPIEPEMYKSDFFPGWIAEQINDVLKFYEYGVSKEYDKWQVILFTNDNISLTSEEKQVLEDALSPAILEIRTPQNAHIDTPVTDKNNNAPSATAIGLAMRLLITTNDDLNINLVPSEAALAQKKEKRILIAANIAATIFVMMIFSIMFLNQKIAKVKADTNQGQQNQTNEDIQSLVSEQTMLQKQITELTDKLNQINNIIQKDSVLRWGPVLKDIGSAIPKNTRLTNINSVSKSSILLNGQAVKYEAIYHFVDALNECKNIESAKEIETKNSGQSNRLFNYSISCELTQ